MAKKLKRKPLHPIKHWFLPHKHNDHRPHLIRLHGLAVMALLIIGVQVTANIMRPPSVRVLAYASNITPVDLLNLTNQERVSNGLPPLRMDARLNNSASLKAGNMFAENYWAHVSPSGIQPWHWFQQAGYSYSYAGENLAKDFDTTAGTVQGWMQSPGHRANLLNANYTDVGFAVQNGNLVGGETTLVVAHYGSVAGVSVAATVPPPTAVKSAPRAVAPVAVPIVAPTPALPTATPAPIPTPTATPSPSLTPKPALTSTPSNSIAPPPQQYSLFRPLSLIRTLNLGTIITLLLLFILLLVYLLTHITVWRKGLKRWSSNHYRLFAAAQVSGLSAVIVLLAVSGFGSVG